ncbi:MAG: hypothetical protein A2Y39_06215 [Candidatus Delongbacteria bacterium GWF2_40_14]|nr:MAG: hypothetical protein A2Y39_06215 [Candidatus Delongbacteria bacterium GWF2_40_14]
MTLKLTTNSRIIGKIATTDNIGKISLTGLCDLCGAFSLDRYGKLPLILEGSKTVYEYKEE